MADETNIKPIDVLFIYAILSPHVGGAAVCGSTMLSTLNKEYRGMFKRIRVLTERGCNIKSDHKLKVKSILLNYDSVSNHQKSFIKQAINYLIIICYILFAKKNIIHIHARYVYAKYIGKIIWLALFISPAKVIIDIRDKFYNNFRVGHNFIICSEDLLDFYSWVQNKHYIPIPIKFPPLNENIKQNHQIAYIGTITENKGVLELLEGYKQYVKESTNPLELHFWGLDTLKDGFEKEIKGIKSAKYCGYISNDEIFEKISEYKAIILPSKSEGMPRICLETMYCNRIIVCHKSLKSIIAYIPEQFVLNDISQEEIKNVLFQLELHDGQISYKYDFSIHYPENSCNKLINVYQQIIK